jgi:predicted dehydrogenase
MIRVRVGFIGGGGIAGRHLRNLRGFEEVEVAAVADPSSESRERFAREANARGYADWAEMLEREVLDALYICTPPFVHGAPELAAVEQGLPFFVEKPLALDGKTAESIAAAVADAGLTTAVGYHWRYLDTVEEVRKRLAEKPARLVSGYWLDSTPPPAWWVRQTQSGGQFIEQTTHIFDLARLLVGEVEEVFAVAGRSPRDAYPECDICETSTAALRFRSGAVGSVLSTCLLNGPHRIGLHLFGDGLAIELTEHELMIDVGRGRPVRRAEEDPFVREDRDFIDAVKGGESRIRAPYAEAVKTHRLTVAATRSAAERRPILLDGAGHG